MAAQRAVDTNSGGGGGTTSIGIVEIGIDAFVQHIGNVGNELKVVENLVGVIELDELNSRRRKHSTITKS